MKAPHSFHVPVMGTGFTIDTPLKVARYGISSVISLVDDHLIESIRKHHCGVFGVPYVPIGSSEPDRRARRITAYLNLLERLVRAQVARVRTAPFEPGSEIVKYFEKLDDRTAPKKLYLRMLGARGAEKEALCSKLRDEVIAGSIDVNIMTKADRENSEDGRALPKEFSDAMAALRGYAKSSLRSSIVFSAGLNLHLYGYIAEFDDFFPDETGRFAKQVILKVSDFRSAFVQAKNLAKKGVWVSEFRIESGLNCGGHAFPTAGLLMGPILDEFCRRREELRELLFPLYKEALAHRGRRCPPEAPPIRLSAQGGVGTAAEHFFLLQRYALDSVGWGTPFLLVPEVTAVDDETLEKLARARAEDVYLSNASPLGVPFYNLRDSASEETRKRGIAAGKPGSPCLNKYLAFNNEYGTPLCVASAAYQRRKIEEIRAKEGLSVSERENQCERVTEKACICRNLGDGALLKYGIREERGKALTPAVCPGPNIVYFSKICTLDHMIAHIYGRDSVLGSIWRPHMFAAEFRLYVDYLRGRLAGPQATAKEATAFEEFKANLLTGAAYYASIADDLFDWLAEKVAFLAELRSLTDEVRGLSPAHPVPAGS